MISLNNYIQVKIKEYLSFDKMLSENDVDVVAIATESGYHSMFTIKALEDGVNVIW